MAPDAGRNGMRSCRLLSKQLRPEGRSFSLDRGELVAGDDLRTQGWKILWTLGEPQPLLCRFTQGASLSLSGSDSR